MFDTFREPHVFTFSVIFAHIASIFTFSVDILSHVSYLFTYSGIFTFDGATHVYRNKSYDKSVMAHMTLYALRQKFNLQTEVELRFCK